jgi:hypothetical protein
MALVSFPAISKFFAFALSSGLVMGLSVPPLQSQEIQTIHPLLAQVPGAEEEPNDYRPLTQESSVLSVQGGARMMREASDAVSKQDYNTALSKLQDARRVFNQLTNFYQELSALFVGINTAISEGHRLKAVETAQFRDEASYQLALVHRAQNQPELAVPLLVQIIRSQNPASDLGQLAYQQLFELGFVDIPFSWEGATNTAPTP